MNRIYLTMLAGWVTGMIVAVTITELTSMSDLMALLVGFALSFVGMMAGGLWAERK